MVTIILLYMVIQIYSTAGGMLLNTHNYRFCNLSDIINVSIIRSYLLHRNFRYPKRKFYYIQVDILIVMYFLFISSFISCSFLRRICRMIMVSITLDRWKINGLSVFTFLIHYQNIQSYLLLIFLVNNHGYRLFTRLPCHFLFSKIIINLSERPTV